MLQSLYKNASFYSEMGRMGFEPTTSGSQNQNLRQLRQKYLTLYQTRPPTQWKMGMKGFEPLIITRNTLFLGISLGLARNRSRTSSSLRQQTLVLKSFWSPASCLAWLHPLARIILPYLKWDLTIREPLCHTQEGRSRLFFPRKKGKSQMEYILLEWWKLSIKKILPSFVFRFFYKNNFHCKNLFKNLI